VRLERICHGWALSGNLLQPIFLRFVEVAVEVGRTPELERLQVVGKVGCGGRI
jgi:hypothetical protein